MNKILNKHCTSTEQALVSYININKHYKHNKHSIEHKIENENCNDFILENNSEKKEKKLREKKNEETESSIPILENILAFFQENKYDQLEAQKFFNYFESNGWLVGGKTKMKNWKAAAKNWMLNSRNYSKPTNTPQPNHLHIQTEKKYDEPL